MLNSIQPIYWTGWIDLSQLGQNFAFFFFVKICNFQVSI